MLNCTRALRDNLLGKSGIGSVDFYASSRELSERLHVRHPDVLNISCRGKWAVGLAGSV
jgi:hypothetical protein